MNILRPFIAKRSASSPWLVTILVAAAFCIGATVSFAAEVKDAHAERDGDEMVFIYDLVGGGAEETVGLTVSLGGKSYSAKKLHLTGDVGSVRTGTGKRISWNIREDFPGGIVEEPGWELYIGRKGFRDPATGMEFVFVKGGCFRMGDSYGDGNKDERPIHEACVDDFYLGKYEVTQGEWRQVMGDNPSIAKTCGDRCPVENVSWKDVNRFLARYAKLSGKPYRLPREAEWEYAARSGGKKEKWAGTSNERKLKEYALFSVSTGSRSRPVGRKKPNALGLYDMSGSVWEWVEDFYDGSFYASSQARNPAGPVNGLSRVQRGGAWNSQAYDLRTARRVRGKEGTGSLNVGFRVALPAE